RKSPKKQPVRTGSEGLPFSQLRAAMCDEGNNFPSHSRMPVLYYISRSRDEKSCKIYKDIFGCYRKITFITRSDKSQPSVVGREHSNDTDL
ncbi:hypothetical protein CDAR_247251, partial [Caerostris darwini]